MIYKMEFKWAHWAPLIGIVFVMFLLFNSNRPLLEGLTEQSTQDRMIDTYTTIAKGIKENSQKTAEDLDKYRPQFEDIVMNLASFSEYAILQELVNTAMVAKNISSPSGQPDIFYKTLDKVEKLSSLRKITEDAMNYMDKSSSTSSSGFM